MDNEIPREQQFGAMAEPGYFSVTKPPAPPPPAPYATGSSPAIDPGFGAKPIYPQAGAPPPTAPPSPITVTTTPAPRVAPLGAAPAVSPGPTAAPGVAERAANAGGFTGTPISGMFGSPAGTPGSGPQYQPPAGEAAPAAPPLPVTNPGPPGMAAGGEGGGALRGYAGSAETAATGAQMVGAPRGPIVGTAAIDSGPGGVFGTPRVDAQNKSYTQADLDRMSAGANPEAIAKMHADYAMMKAGEQQAAQEQFGRRDASIKSEIQRGKDYWAEVAQRNANVDARVASIHNRQVAFGPAGGRVAGTSNADRATAAANPRDFFKEAATGLEQGRAAVKAVSDEKTAGLERQGKTADIAGKQVDAKGKQLDLAAKQRLDALGQKIAGGNSTPADHAAYLALTGKDKPDDFIVTHAAGGTHTGPDGMTQIKDPDTVIVTNKKTGVSSIATHGGQAGAAAAKPAPAPRDEWIKQQKVANPAIDVKQLEKMYDSNFGGRTALTP